MVDFIYGAPVVAHLIIGAVIGALLSGFGAYLSYRNGLRVDNERSVAPLGYMLLFSLALGLLGLLVTTLGWFLAGQVRTALVVGAGVLLGFGAVFVVLTLFWLRRPPE